MGMMTKRLRNVWWLGVLLVGILGGAPLAPPWRSESTPRIHAARHDGGKISLSQFRGKTAVLIEFYGAVIFRRREPRTWRPGRPIMISFKS